MAGKKETFKFKSEQQKGLIELFQKEHGPWNV